MQILRTTPRLLSTRATGARVVVRLSQPSSLVVPRGLAVRSFANVGDVIDVKIPQMGESVSEGGLKSWEKAVGDVVKPLDVVAIVETDKISVDITSEQHGIIQELKAQPGDTVKVGDILFSMKVTEAPKEAPAPPKEAPAPAAPAPKASAPKPAAPAPKTASAAAPVFATVAPATGPPQAGRPELRVTMSRLRQRVAQRLKDSQNTAAMLTTFQEVNMGPLMDMRKQYKDLFLEKHQVKLGFMSAFVKAATSTLLDIPALNGIIDGNDIVYHQYVDMSVAVATPTGLMVPVIRNTEKLSFAEIEKAIAALAEKARKGTIGLDDMAGGTFTISNGGVYGSLFGTPIINPPQSAILGMHATKVRPVVENGQIVARPMMYMALTYDHRLVDGAEAVTFLCNVRDKIEDPKRLLLEL